MEQYHTSCYIALGDPITSPHMVGKAYDSAVSNLSGHFFTPDEHIYGFSKNVNPDFVSYPFENLLEEMAEDVVVVGDAIAPRKILTAIHEGYHAIRVME